MLHQKKLFTKDEVYKIRNYITKLDDRVIGTLHPDVNEGKHDPQGDTTQQNIFNGTMHQKNTHGFMME